MALASSKCHLGVCPQFFYKLTLPKPAPKRDETVLSEFWEDVDNSQSRVAHCDGYPSHSATPHSRTARPLPVAQRDPIIYRSSKENPDGHNPPHEAADVEMPGRFAFGVARRDGTLDDVLRKIDAASQEMKRREEKSLLQLAIDATGMEFWGRAPRNARFTRLYAISQPFE